MFWRKRATNRHGPHIRAERVQACLLAGAVADAMAFAHEGRSPGPLSELRVGSISDDTQLTLATCEAILAASGAVHPERVAEAFVRWHREYGFIGAGAATMKAVQELSIGGHWALVGRKGEMAAGNGAAVRIAPLAFALRLSDPGARRTFRDVCRITHHSDEAYVGALAIARTIQCAALGTWHGRDALFEMLLDELPDTRLRDRLCAFRGREDSVASLGAQFGTSGYVVESVPLALHAYALAAESGDVRTMVRAIIEAGGDCDSIGPMAAQCLGALRTDALSARDAERLPAFVHPVAERFATARDSGHRLM